MQEKILEVKMFELMPHGDDRGQLVAIEEMKDIPFEVKRVYYMYDTVNSAVRGKHAHKSLEQVLICVSGSCKVRLDDGMGDVSEVILDRPNLGLYISNDMWREMYDFSDDAVLMVLASEYYTENDYIRDYETFLEYVKEKN